MHDGAAIHLHHVQQALRVDRRKFAVLAETGVVDQQVDFNFLFTRKRKNLSRRARLRQIRRETSVFTLCFAINVRANSSRRSLRRAVSTRCVPLAANSSVSAMPMPALAP